MTNNPFDAAGGGFDMNALLQQAQQMQEQLQNAQERLLEQTVVGTVANGAISVTVNGVGEIQSVDIKAGQFDGSNTEDLADLSDMIVAAYRDAKSKAEGLANEAMAPLAGGLEGLGGMGGLGAGPEGGSPTGQLGF